MKAFKYLLGLLAVVQIASAKVIYVDDDSSPGGDGRGWITAYNDLQDAFTNASIEDEIWVAEGTYINEEGFSISDMQSSGNKYLRVFGGFKNGATSKSNRDFSKTRTIIDGDIQQDDLADWSNRTDNKKLLTITSSGSIHFDGIDFKNGVGDKPGTGERQAVISIYSSNVIFHKCFFYRNGYSNRDPMGVLRSENSNVDFWNCVFVENTGGIAYLRSIGSSNNVKFRKSVFHNNYPNKFKSLVVSFSSLDTGSNNSSLYYSTVVGDQKFFSLYTDSAGGGNVFYSTGTLFNDDPTNQQIDKHYTDSIHTGYEFFNINKPEGSDQVWGTEDDGLRLIYSESLTVDIEEDLVSIYDSHDLDQDGAINDMIPYNLYGKLVSSYPVTMIGAYDLKTTSSTDRLTFTVNLNSSTGGTVSGGGTFDEDASVTLTATPSNSGYIFSGWSGDASGTSNPLNITADSDKTITANFSKDDEDDDGDGISNYEEIVTYGTSKSSNDSDGDGLTDKEETERGLNPNSSDKAIIDAVMELKGMKADNVTPIVNDWYYVPNRGWFWTSKDVYPYTYSAEDNDWMYFQSGNDKPKFYRYKTKTWLTVE